MVPVEQESRGLLLKYKWPHLGFIPELFRNALYIGYIDGTSEIGISKNTENEMEHVTNNL